MRHILTFSWRQGGKDQAEGIARFRKVGATSPKGVKLIGRWTRADFSGGTVLLETDDAKALAEFALLWSDLMELSTSPVLDDAELSAALERAGR